KPSFARNCRDFWAPSPLVREDNQFRFYYTVKPDDHPGLGISVAVSEQPDRGFMDRRSGPLRQDTGFRVIDPHYLLDPRTGMKWLYWGSHEAPISVQALREDGLDFELGSEPKAVLSPPGDEPFRRLLEGFFVVYHEATGRFFGFASGSNTWKPHEYGISVYWAPDPDAQFVPIPGDNVIVRPTARWLAPGQCSFVMDEAGDPWLYHHAVDAHDPRNEWATRAIYRIMCRTKLTFEDGYPRAIGSAPR
ncbi:MAG TPA: family 43 glycosylhydrolase, partial [Armatimonadota bacterium]|nr:family 43 glycosylhydrolase [Armatimonadota bacterium]